MMIHTQLTSCFYHRGTINWRFNAPNRTSIYIYIYIYVYILYIYNRSESNIISEYYNSIIYCVKYDIYEICILHIGIFFA